MTTTDAATKKNALRENAIERLLELHDKNMIKDKASLSSVLAVIWFSRSGYFSSVSKDDEDEETLAECCLLWRKAKILVREAAIAQCA